MLEKIIKILSDYTTASEITETSILVSDLGLSSFEIVSIVEDFEDTFGIEISDRDIARFICVQDILNYLGTHT